MFFLSPRLYSICNKSALPLQAKTPIFSVGIFTQAKKPTPIHPHYTQSHGTHIDSFRSLFVYCFFHNNCYCKEKKIVTFWCVLKEKKKNVIDVHIRSQIKFNWWFLFKKKEISQRSRANSGQKKRWTCVLSTK